MAKPGVRFGAGKDRVIRMTSTLPALTHQARPDLPAEAAYLAGRPCALLPLPSVNPDETWAWFPGTGQAGGAGLFSGGTIRVRREWLEEAAA